MCRLHPYIAEGDFNKVLVLLSSLLKACWLFSQYRFEFILCPAYFRRVRRPRRYALATGTCVLTGFAQGGHTVAVKIRQTCLYLSEGLPSLRRCGMLFRPLAGLVD